MTKRAALLAREAASRADRGAGAARPTESGPIPFWNRPWALFAFVGLVAFAAFTPSLRNGFVDWDDGKNLLDNLAYRGLGPEQLRWMWTTFHLGPYQPLSWMTYGLDYLLWGLRPFGYHLTSVLLHAIGAGLFAVVAARLFLLCGTAWPGRLAANDTGPAAPSSHSRTAAAAPRAGTAAVAPGSRTAAASSRAGTAAPSSHSRTAAVAAQARTTAVAFGVLAAILWSIHPLRVEAVSWATERREVLCGVFSLLTLLVHLAGRGRIPTALCALAAMLSKGTAVVLPALLVLIDGHAAAIGSHAAAPAGFRDLRTAALRSIRRHAPILTLSIVFGVLAVIGQSKAEAVADLQHVGFPDRILLLAHSLGFYALKTVWPTGLAPLYEMSSDLTRVRVWGAVSAAAIAAVFAIAIVRRATLPALLPLLVAYVALVAPVGGLLQVGTQVAADRYAYAAGWALSLMAASTIGRAIALAGARASHGPGTGRRPLAADGEASGRTLDPGDRSASTARDRVEPAGAPRRPVDAARARSGGALRSPALLLAAAALLGLPLGRLAVRQQRIWRDAESLWTHQLAEYPDTATAHYSLALGRVTGERGVEADLWAEPHFREAIRIQPTRPEAYRGLANVLRRTQRLEEAITIYQDGLRVAPRNGPLTYGLALAWWEQGRRQDAIGKLRELAATPPDNADSHLVLARALAAHGEVPDAAREYQRAIDSPTDAPAVAPMELAWLLATHPDLRHRDGDRALALAERAMRLGRELSARGGLALRAGLDARLVRTLAAALAEKGRFDDASDLLRREAGAFTADRRAEIEEWLAGFARREPIRAVPQFP